MIELNQDQLGQCVTYFIQGSPMQIVGGVLTMIAILLPVLTKWNVPDAIKGIFAPMMKKPAEKIVTVNATVETASPEETKAIVEELTDVKTPRNP